VAVMVYVVIAVGLLVVVGTGLRGRRDRAAVEEKIEEKVDA